MSRYRFAGRAATLGKSVYDHAPGVIMLSVGSAYPPLLPDLALEAADAAKAYIAEVMQYGPLMGLPELREAIAAHVAQDGVTCSPDQILITNGAKHATDLAARVFTEPGDKIIVSAPTYMTSLQSLRMHGLVFVAIPQDDDGMQTDVLAHRLATMRANGEPLPKLLFDIPDFHNPTGITMSLGRRKALLDLAREYGFVIIEDDPYRRIRFEGEPVPPIKSLDTEGRVIAVGTVSKVLAPGLRIGWAIADPEIVRRMAMQKADGGSCPFTQRLVVSAIQTNKLAEHIDMVTESMRDHRDAMVEALAEHLPEAEVRKPNGGYFLWARLPEGQSGDALAAKAVEFGVEVGSGRLCFPNEDPGNFIRFAYSYVDPDTIREGIKRLGQAYRSTEAAA